MSATQIIGNTDNLSTLAAALQATGQNAVLDDDATTFTVFAPANTAFDNVDVQSLTDTPDLTRDLLNFHIVQGEALTASDLEGRQSVTTVEGQELSIGSQDGTLTVGGIPVSQADVEASNGVAHVIGGVLVPDSFPRRTSDDLAAQSNAGAIPNGVKGTVTFWEVDDDQSLVTLSLTDGPTGAAVSHPAHIHAGNASEGGPIEIYLSPLDGTNANDANPGTSVRLVDRSFDDLADLDGYVNIHESVANLNIVVSQGNIGANAQGTFGAGLQLVDNPRTTTYPLSANANSGNVAPNGIPGEVQFRELTADRTLATVRLDPDDDGQFEEGATGADVSHPAHIHANRASEGGPIQFYLSPIDGTDPAARSSQILDEMFSNPTSIDGYVNVHESAATLQNIVSQGNIGANAGNGNAADVTIALSNDGASAYIVTDVQGASGVARTNTDNPSLTLTVGTRYRIDNTAGINAHPFALEDANDNYLLRQEADATGSLEGDSGIDHAEDDEGITFTFTQDLADAVNNHRCTFHAAMEGAVETNTTSGSITY